MGGRHQKKRKGNSKIKRERKSVPDGSYTMMEAKDLGNYKMESYYAALGLHNWRWSAEATPRLVPCESDAEKQTERLQWRETLQKVLPASFRFGQDVNPKLKQSLEAELHEFLDAALEKDPSLPPTLHLPFVDAYQLGLDRSTIRKRDDLKPLHEWLKTHTASGHISRQETVSMIPPVVLHVQPTDAVLDMCAAPGSKTAQMLEALGPHGLMIANDANAQRAYMLVSQLKRVLHNNPVALVTACDAQLFPALQQFDKILADVPCSGDGTCRKNIGMWKTWSQMNAFALHSLQVPIAWKGLQQLLKVGGTMVYSTCSMNPIENEAVVAELLRRGEGQIELVEYHVPGFRARLGWTDWKVLCENKTRRQMKDESKKNSERMRQRRQQFAQDSTDNGDSTTAHQADASLQVEDKQPSNELATDVALASCKYDPTSMDDDNVMQLSTKTGYIHYPSYDDVPESLHRRVRQSCFPPSAEEATKFHLERCLRILPHDNNTGGFFVALLRKMGQLSRKDREASAGNDPGAEPETKRAKNEVEDDQIVGADDDGDDFEVEGLDADNVPVSRKRVKDSNWDNQKKAAPTSDCFSPIPDVVLGPVLEYYGLSTLDKALVMARSYGEAKAFYYVAASVKNVLDTCLQERVEVINTGLKAFARNTQECGIGYRVTQEAVAFIAPHMTKRKVVVSSDDFDRCISNDAIALDGFSSEFQKNVRTLEVGSFVAVLDGLENDYASKMVLTMWRCRGDNICGLIPKVELDVMRGKLKSVLSAREIVVDGYADGPNVP